MKLLQLLMTYLSIDYGLSKTGIAVSDEYGIVAKALETIKAKDKSKLLRTLKELISKYKIEVIVLGLPVGYYGDTEQTTLTRGFAEELSKETGLKVILWDESYSSKKAELGARSRKRENSDSEAARIILQEYLDSTDKN
ncbi:MAG: Holliday junction resolvase RuvX [Candidatus Dojkabacteria bacterium]|uniref:Putative pre-16S rRNA nuclease n=2 Tax=Candidatus Dojkabacteria TaxID=74243 RepID=A0A952DRN0_9BACT|nr:Holliday junction resolvase RuvX [Candidatus Dojkabacteria bacterium]WKZ27606.1 MAG: Holliday junction resolvase RuvX [Candidatus Dojkabacteria bacterium]